MTDKEQTDAFANDLDKLLQRYYDEFNLSYAQAIGVLQIKSWLLIRDAAEDDDEVESD